MAVGEDIVKSSGVGGEVVEKPLLKTFRYGTLRLITERDDDKE